MRGGRAEILGSPAPASSHRGEGGSLKIVTIEDILHVFIQYIIIPSNGSGADRVLPNRHLRLLRGGDVRELGPRPPLRARQVRSENIFLTADYNKYFYDFISSWDAYFRGGTYAAPPSLGDSTRPNEVPLSSLGAWQGAGQVNTGL